MSFLLLTIVSASVSWLLFWIGKWWLSFIPIAFLLLYSGDFISQFSFKSTSKNITREHGALLSWLCIMIGLLLLWHTQSISRYYTTWCIIATNIILLLLSYYHDYKEGMSIFSRWIVISRLLTLAVWWYYHLSSDTLIIISTGASIQVFGTWYIITYFYDHHKEQHQKALLHKEIRAYISIYIISYYIFSGNSVGIVIQLWCTTFLIALRQHFLSYQSTLRHEKSEWLTGRALLQGQKILKRYEDKKDSTYSIMNNFLRRWRIPSHDGLQFLQIAQGIQIVLLIGTSIRQLYHHGDHVLIWYRLGVACFMISLFGIERQDKLFWRYKKFALIIVSGALYVTIFSQSTSRNTIVLWSLAWNCINMFTCLFYDLIIPEPKRILTRNDLLFWMLRTNLTVVVTLLSLFKLQLGGDTLFALWCIIIGTMSFFSYHIWKKYSLV